MVLYPIEQVLMMPRDVFYWFTKYGTVIIDTVDRRADIEKREVDSAAALLQFEQLRTENESLRVLLDLRKEIKHRTIAAEISHETRDAFSNRIVIDRGSQHGVAPGHPVINARGVVGQVIRVSPITSEVSLVTDPSLVIPVNLPRTGIRSVATGTGDGQQVELKYLNINAEVEVGDVLVTSGLAHLPPIKVVTILAGVAQISFAFFVLSCIIARGARFYALAWALRRFGEPIRSFIERRLGLLAAIVAGLVILLYVLVKYTSIAGSMTAC